MNHSYCSYINPQQYNNYARNITPRAIISNSPNLAVQKNVGYNNNINNNIKINNNNKTYNNNFTPKSVKMNSRNKKKNVKFNENVSVIKVVSYKEYNKIDDNTGLDNVYYDKINKYKSNYVNTDPNNIDKKTKNCECNIM